MSTFVGPNRATHTNKLCTRVVVPKIVNTKSILQAFARERHMCTARELNPKVQRQSIESMPAKPNSGEGGFDLAFVVQQRAYKDPTRHDSLALRSVL